MFKQKPKLLASVFRVSLLAMLVIGVATSFVTLQKPQRANAVTNSTLNFQARLLTAAGSTVPDGDYNVEFKLFNAASSSGSSQGSCSGDAACLWAETRTTSNKVRVVNGYLTVNLGSVNAFSTTINWDQEMWLTMRVGGIGSPSWDSEMAPRLKLTAVPYAFRAGTLVAQNGANINTVSFAAPTATRTITIPDESGTVCLQSSSACGFLTSAAANSSYIQNQTSVSQVANFRINGTGRADVSLQAPLLDTAGAQVLDIGTTNATGINLNQNTSIASGKTLTVQGTSLFKPASGSATALQVQNTNSDAVFAVDTSANQAVFGTASAVTGKMLFRNSSNSNTVTVQSGTTSATYALTLPTALGSSGDCLKDTNGSGALGFSSCGGGSASLQGAYDGGNTVTTTSARDIGITLADTATDSIFSVNMQCTTCSSNGGRFEIQNAGTAAFWLNPGTAAGQRGTAVFRNTTNDVNAFRVQVAGGGSTVFNVDTSNARVGINNAGPSYALDVTGDTNISSGSAYKINGTNICTSSGCTASSASAILNQTTVQSANMYVQAATTGTVAAKFRAFNGGSGDIANFLNGTGTTVGSISSTGAVLVKPSTDSTSAFQVQPSGSTTPVLNVDTSNSRVGIGTATPSTTFNIAINNTQVTTPMMILEQAGTGDATIQFKNTSNSFYAGIDTSDSTSFSINSSTSAGAVAPNTITHVQSAVSTFDTGGLVGSQTRSFVSNNTAGNLIVVAATWDMSNSSAITCSDSRGNSYSSAIIDIDAPHTQALAVCYAMNIAAGANTVTVTYGASSNFIQMSVHEYSGVATVSALDTNSSNDAVGAGGTDGYTSNASSTTVSGDLIYGAMFKTSGAPNAITPGTGFTQRINSNDFATEDKIQSTAGSVAATFTGGTFSYVAHMLAFKATTTGGSVTDTNASSLFKLSQTGSAVFKNYTNSSAALQVQNAAGVQQLAVDTSTSRIYVGPTAGSTTGTLLVLGNKTDAGDPTGVAGAMYYNSNAGKFRCFEGGQWINCIGSLTSANTAASTAITTCTNACASFSTNAAIPADYCQPGRVIHVIASGVYSTNTATNPTLGFGVYYGTNATTRGSNTLIGVASTGLTTGAGVSNVGWNLDFYITCFSTTSMNGQGTTRVATTTTAAGTSLMYTNAATSVTSNTAKNLYIFPTWQTSNANNSVTVQQFIVQAL